MRLFYNSKTGRMHSFSRAQMVTHHLEHLDGGMEEKKNKAKADVFVWRALDAQTRKNLEAQLAQFSGKQVELNIKEEPNLIGGIKVRLGDWVMDSSLRGRLQRMKESFNHGN
jgi:F-type H+-transporting ATPase subunit delta